MTLLDNLPTGTSRDKILGALSKLDQVDTGGDEVMASLLTMATSMGVPAMVASRLPEDPADLDQLLALGAHVLLQLRSDDAGYVGLTSFQGDVGASPGLFEATEPDPAEPVSPVHHDASDALAPEPMGAVMPEPEDDGLS